MGRNIDHRQQSLLAEEGKESKGVAISNEKDQLLIVKAHHSELTFGHFGLMKTWRGIA